jgi:predicted enzyme related to lactoylglutathione lyase
MRAGSADPEAKEEMMELAMNTIDLIVSDMEAAITFYGRPLRAAKEAIGSTRSLRPGASASSAGLASSASRSTRSARC